MLKTSSQLHACVSAQGAFSQNGASEWALHICQTSNFSPFILSEVSDHGLELIYTNIYMYIYIMYIYLGLEDAAPADLMMK